MKKLLALLLALVMVFSLCACGAKEEAPAAPAEEAPAAPAEEAPAAPVAEGEYDLTGCKPVKLVFANPSSSTEVQSIYAKQFCEMVTEKSQGLITFEYSDGGTLGTIQELLDGTNMGIYDFCLADTSFFETWVPEAVVVTMPFLTDNFDHANKVFNSEVGDWFNGLVMDATNLRIMGYGFTGFRYILSENEIDSLEDCEGTLIRSPEINVYTDLLSMMGFSYVTMAWSEAYTAMSTGIVNAVECPLMNLYEQGFYSLGQNIYNTRHLLSVCTYVMNDDTYNSLPDVYKQIIDDCMAEAIVGERETCAANEAGYMEKLEAEGCVFHDLEGESYDRIQEMFGEYWMTRAAEFGGEAADMLQVVIDLKG